MSHKMKSHVFCIEMVKSKNYVNKKGENPKINSVIKWNNVVFSLKEAGENDWCFCNTEDEVVSLAIKQWEDLKIFDDDIFILE